MAVIIRLQNLPWSANAVDIRRFFAGRSIPEGGVHIVGGEDGDAFIAFSSDEDARLAMRLDSQQIKGIRVRLYLSSKAEMQSVITAAREVTSSNKPTSRSVMHDSHASNNPTVIIPREVPDSYQPQRLIRDCLPMDSNTTTSSLVPQRQSIGIPLHPDHQDLREIPNTSISSSNTNCLGNESWSDFHGQDRYQRSIQSQQHIPSDIQSQTDMPVRNQHYLHSHISSAAQNRHDIQRRSQPYSLSQNPPVMQDLVDLQPYSQPQNPTNVQDLHEMRTRNQSYPQSQSSPNIQNMQDMLMRNPKYLHSPRDTTIHNASDMQIRNQPYPQTQSSSFKPSDNQRTSYPLQNSSPQNQRYVPIQSPRSHHSYQSEDGTIATPYQPCRQSDKGYPQTFSMSQRPSSYSQLNPRDESDHQKFKQSVSDSSEYQLQGESTHLELNRRQPSANSGPTQAYADTYRSVDHRHLPEERDHVRGVVGRPHEKQYSRPSCEGPFPIRVESFPDRTQRDQDDNLKEIEYMEDINERTLPSQPIHSIRHERNVNKPFFNEDYESYEGNRWRLQENDMRGRPNIQCQPGHGLNPDRYLPIRESYSVSKGSVQNTSKPTTSNAPCRENSRFNRMNPENYNERCGLSGQRDSEFGRWDDKSDNRSDDFPQNHYGTAQTYFDGDQSGYVEPCRHETAKRDGYGYQWQNENPARYSEQGSSARRERNDEKTTEIDFSQLPPWLRDDDNVSSSNRGNISHQSKFSGKYSEYPQKRHAESIPSFPNSYVDNFRPGNRSRFDTHEYSNRRSGPTNALLETPTTVNPRTSKAERRSLLNHPTDHDMRGLPLLCERSDDRDRHSVDEPQHKRGRHSDRSILCTPDSDGNANNENFQRPSAKPYPHHTRPSLYVKLTNCELFWSPRAMFQVFRDIKVAKPIGFRFEVDKIGRRTGNIFAKLASIDYFDKMTSYDGMPVHDGRLKLGVEGCTVEEFFSVDEAGDERPSNVKKLPVPLYYKDMCVEIVGLPTFYKKTDIVKLFSDACLDPNDVCVEIDEADKCTGKAYITCRRREDFELILGKNGRLIYQEPFRILAISSCQLSVFWNKYKRGESDSQRNDTRERSSRSNQYCNRREGDGSMERSSERAFPGRDRNEDRDRDRRDSRNRDRRDSRESERRERDRDRDRSFSRNSDERGHDPFRKDKKHHPCDPVSKRNEQNTETRTRRSANSKSPVSHDNEHKSNSPVADNSSSNTTFVKTDSSQKSTRGEQDSRGCNSPSFGCQLLNIPKNISVTDIASFIGRDKISTDGIYISSSQDCAIVVAVNELSNKQICLKDGQKIKSNSIRVHALTASDLKSKLQDFKRDGMESNVRNTKSNSEQLGNAESSTIKESSSREQTDKSEAQVADNSPQPRLTIGNLPVSATVSKVEDFFQGYDFIPGSVSLRMSAQGKPLGEAVIAFQSAVEVDRVLREFQGKKMGGRLISLRYGTA